MKKLYLHEGAGHYIGSTVLVCAENIEDAEQLIRSELDSHGLPEEPLNIREMKIQSNSVIISDGGDY